ncbi:MAG TPA: 30S ribosomal protein S8 [Solirubrobacterales bacterium]|jgi:small subunit ribosomal protein S8|nr:30S ribosomal protein S8 [Solirubrobacterales bacterium]
MLTDPVSDYLTRIRNALTAQHLEVEVPASRLKKDMSRLLAEQGYISEFSVEPTPVGEVIRIKLRYTEDRQPVISGLQRVSRPGRRRYVDHTQVPKVQGGMGTAIVSTSSGVMTGHEAKAKGVGGEVVAYVW